MKGLKERGEERSQFRRGEIVVIVESEKGKKRLARSC